MADQISGLEKRRERAVGLWLRLYRTVPCPPLAAYEALSSSIWRCCSVSQHVLSQTGLPRHSQHAPCFTLSGRRDVHTRALSLPDMFDLLATFDVN